MHSHAQGCYSHAADHQMAAPATDLLVEFETVELTAVPCDELVSIVVPQEVAKHAEEMAFALHAQR